MHFVHFVPNKPDQEQHSQVCLSLILPMLCPLGVVAILL